MSQAARSVPRRHCVDLMTPAELAIRNALIKVEAIGADVRLTDAVNFLEWARERVADFVDNTPSLERPSMPARPAKALSMAEVLGRIPLLLEEMKDSGSWDAATLNRVIENICPSIRAALAREER